MRLQVLLTSLDKDLYPSLIIYLFLQQFIEKSGIVIKVITVIELKEMFAFCWT